jgi:hypothetical protein
MTHWQMQCHFARAARQTKDEIAHPGRESVPGRLPPRGHDRAVRRARTTALHKCDVEYGDISYIAWAYEQDVPRTGFAVGHAAGVPTPLTWPNRPSALRRNEEIRGIWEQRQRGGKESVGPNEVERNGDLRDELGTGDQPGGRNPWSGIWQQIGNTIGDVNPMRLQRKSVQRES